MWKARLIRISLLSIACLLVFGGVKAFATWRQTHPGGLQDLKLQSLPNFPIEEKVKGIEIQNITDVFQGNKKQDQKQQEAITPTPEVKGVEAPVQNVQNQTQNLIESIKTLPEDQLNAIKQELFKGICEDISKGTN